MMKVMKVSAKLKISTIPMLVVVSFANLLMGGVHASLGGPY